jgi:hypothetical protein
LSRDGDLLKMVRNSVVICSNCSAVQSSSTYFHQSFPSLERGISQLDHLHARWIQTHATNVGRYCKHIVVKCRLLYSQRHLLYHQLFTLHQSYMYIYYPPSLNEPVCSHEVRSLSQIFTRYRLKNNIYRVIII